MIFKVCGQRNAHGTVDRCGNGMPPGGERRGTRGNRKGGVACSPRIELKRYM